MRRRGLLWGARLLAVLTILALPLSAPALASRGASLFPVLDRPLAGRPLAGLSGTRIVLFATQRGQAGALAEAVRAAGGQVRAQYDESDFVIARLDAAAASHLAEGPLVAAAAADRPLHLDRGELTRPEIMAGEPQPQVNEDPGASLDITAGEIRVPQFSARHGDGQGVVVAVLDTGVDPGHPDLQLTSDGSPKLADWQDMTGEGDIDTRETAPADIPGIVSRSGQYHLGYYKESSLPAGELGQDLNRNGKTDDQFKVIVSDAHQAGVYDTVYVDTLGDGSVTADRPMQAFKDGHETNHFGSGEADGEKKGTFKGVNFVVTSIAADGSKINLGFDGGQHGTHVAGIIAGNGALHGVAPGAQIMAIKVLTSGGSGDWSGILAGMKYAAENGARVINMSLGGMAELNDGSDPQSQFVDKLTARHGVVFSIAAGNSGPGLQSVGLPGAATCAITSGAYVSPATFKNDYGLDVPEEGLWYFSSQGPRADGGLKPDIVSPGAARSTIPPWAGSYAVFQGTSMATPQTAGAAALLLAAAQDSGVPAGPLAVKHALAQSARRLEGYRFVEQGHGLIQVDAAWMALRRLAAEQPPAVAASVQTPEGTRPNLYARGWLPESRQRLTLQGNAALELQYENEGLTVAGPGSADVSGKSAVDLRYGVPAEPGLYDSLLTARVPGQASPALEFLSTVIVPHTFDAAAGNAVTGLSGSLGPARYQRYFFAVPAGTSQLNLKLTVPQGDDGNHQGRVRVMAYAPSGRAEGPGSGYAGAPKGPGTVEYPIANPQPGVWEVDVYASHGSALYGVTENRYSLDVTARGIYARPQALKLPPALGQTVQRQVTFTNLLADFTGGAVGSALVQPETAIAPVKQDGVSDHFVDVPEGTALFRVEVVGKADLAAQVTIGVYHEDPQTGWTPVGHVVRGSLGRQTVTLLAPKPGKYAFELGSSGGRLAYNGVVYRTALVGSGDAVQVTDAEAAHAFGSQWTATVSVAVPPDVGPYLGAVSVKDKDGKLLTVVPVEVL